MNMVKQTKRTSKRKAYLSKAEQRTVANDKVTKAANPSPIKPLAKPKVVIEPSLEDQITMLKTKLKSQTSKTGVANKRFTDCQKELLAARSDNLIHDELCNAYEAKIKILRDDNILLLESGKRLEDEIKASNTLSDHHFNSVKHFKIKNINLETKLRQSWKISKVITCAVGFAIGIAIYTYLNL